MLIVACNSTHLKPRMQQQKKFHLAPGPRLLVFLVVVPIAEDLGIFSRRASCGFCHVLMAVGLIGVWSLTRVWQTIFTSEWGSRLSGIVLSTFCPSPCRPAITTSYASFVAAFGISAARYDLVHQPSQIVLIGNEISANRVIGAVSLVPVTPGRNSGPLLMRSSKCSRRGRSTGYRQRRSGSTRVEQ